MNQLRLWNTWMCSTLKQLLCMQNWERTLLSLTTYDESVPCVKCVFMVTLTYTHTTHNIFRIISELIIGGSKPLWDAHSLVLSLQHSSVKFSCSGLHLQFIFLRATRYFYVFFKGTKIPRRKQKNYLFCKPCKESEIKNDVFYNYFSLLLNHTC